LTLLILSLLTLNLVTLTLLIVILIIFALRDFVLIFILLTLTLLTLTLVTLTLLILILLTLTLLNLILTTLTLPAHFHPAHLDPADHNPDHHDPAHVVHAHLSPGVLQEWVHNSIKLLERGIATDLHASSDADPWLGGQLDEAGDPFLPVLALQTQVPDWLMGLTWGFPIGWRCFLGVFSCLWVKFKIEIRKEWIKTNFTGFFTLDPTWWTVDNAITAQFYILNRSLIFL
jgi:hypothetical protein